MSAAAINPAPSQPAAGASPTGAAHAGAAGGPGAAAPPVLGVFDSLLASLGAEQDGTAASDPAATATATVTVTAPGGKAAAGGKAAPDAGKAKDKADGDGKAPTGDAAATQTTGVATPDALGLLAPVLPATLAATPLLTSSPGSQDDSDGDAGLPQTAAAALTPDRVPGATAAAVHAAQLAARTEPDLKEAEDKTPLGPLVSAAARAANGSAANAAANAPAGAPVDAATQSKPAAGAAPQGAAPATTATVQPTEIPQTPSPSQSATDAAPAAPATPDLPVLAAASAAVVASAQAAAAAPQDTAAQPPAPPAAKDKGPAPKAAARVDGAKADAAPAGIATLTAKAADALQPTTGAAASAPHADDEAPSPAADSDAGPQGSANQAQGPADPGAATPSAATSAGLIHAAAVAVRGAPQTVAALAAQIVKKLDGRASRFDVQLDPAGLGKVDVRIAIGADGRMTAAMSFDTPQAAAELRARAGELHEAMAQAGFDLSGGMSFDVASDRGQGGQAQNHPESGAAWRGRAFQAALDTSDPAPAPQLNLRRSALAGVDIRI